MRIEITKKHSQVAGFISWNRLATSLFPAGGEIKPGEQITSLEITDRGINFFVADVKADSSPCK